MLEIIACDNDKKGPSILVVGVGGGGNNAVDRMIEANLKGVNFASVNTDIAVLDSSRAELKLQIGTKLLKGYGAGADPALGEAAAEENEEDIRQMVEGRDMVIITCGMGGGTGTGAAPVIAKICHELGILTMGVVTMPFSFENKPRMIAAEGGVAKLKENVDTLLIIPNDKLLEITDKQMKLRDAFILADSVLKYTIEGISNIVYNRGEINIDFNDVKTTLVNKGIGHLGIGIVNGDGSILEAVKQAVNSPLLDTHIEGAANLLVNTSGDISLIALNEAVSYIKELAGEDVNIIWGTVTGDVFDEDKIVVTIIATGMPEVNRKTAIRPQPTKFELPKMDIPKNTTVPPVKIDPTGKNGFIPYNKPKATVKNQQIDVPIFLRDYSTRQIEAERKNK